MRDDSANEFGAKVKISCLDVVKQYLGDSFEKFVIFVGEDLPRKIIQKGFQEILDQEDHLLV